MMHVGASLNASISSGAGFGTLVMAVVMLMQIVSHWWLQRVRACNRRCAERSIILFWRSATRRNIGSAMQFCPLPT